MQTYQSNETVCVGYKLYKVQAAVPSSTTAEAGEMYRKCEVGKSGSLSLQSRRAGSRTVCAYCYCYIDRDFYSVLDSTL